MVLKRGKQLIADPETVQTRPLAVDLLNKLSHSNTPVITIVPLYRYL